jgi:hypothetical protein
MDREKIVAAAGMFHALLNLPLVAATEQAKQCDEAELNAVLACKETATAELQRIFEVGSERRRAAHEKELADEAAARDS